MIKQRPEVVNYLATAALTGLAHAVDHGQPDATNEEMFSACFTVWTRAVDTMLHIWPHTRPVIIGALQKMLLELSQDSPDIRDFDTPKIVH